MSRYRVLVADDSEDDRRVIVRHLRKDPAREYEFAQAASGQAALERLAQERFDVLILDWHLGDMTGGDIVRKVRSEVASELAIVVLTGSGGEGRDPLELGANDYIKKDEMTASQLRQSIANARVKARTHAELQRSRMQLQAALAEVTERMEFERKLLAVVGHDLRNPLQAIMTGLSVLEATSDLEPRGRDILERVSRSARHMSSIVLQLLDLTRIKESSGFPIERADLEDVCEIVTDRVAELQDLHPDRNIDVDCEGNVAGSFDGTALGQLVGNLVGNAITHGVPEQPIAVRVHAAEHILHLEVSNGVAGLSDELLSTMFAPFSRGTHDRSGLGLGLFISQQIARAHGGDITARLDGDRLAINTTLHFNAPPTTTTAAP